MGDAKLLADMQVVGVLNSGKKIDYASALRLGDVPRAAHRLAQRILGGLPRAAAALSAAEVRGRLPVQRRRHFQPDPAFAEGRRGLSREPDDPGGKRRLRRRGAAPKYSASAAELQKLAGAYLSQETGRLLRVTAAGKGLVAESGSEKLTLAPAAAGLFRVEGSKDDAEVRFAPGSGGRPVMRLTTGDRRRPGDRGVRPGRPRVAGPGGARRARRDVLERRARDDLAARRREREAVRPPSRPAEGTARADREGRDEPRRA